MFQLQLSISESMVVLEPMSLSIDFPNCFWMAFCFLHNETLPSTNNILPASCILFNHVKCLCLYAVCVQAKGVSCCLPSLYILCMWNQYPQSYSFSLFGLIFNGLCRAFVIWSIILNPLGFFSKSLILNCRRTGTYLV